MADLPAVTLVHGDYPRLSREFFHSFIDQAKTKGYLELVRLDGRDLDLTSLVEACEALPLLGGKRLVTLENLYANRSKTFINTINSYLQEIIRRQEKLGSNPLIIWENRLLSKAQLKPFAGASIKVFQIPTVIFKFLESLAPGRQPQFIPNYKHLLKIEAPENLLIMIARQIRLLIQIADPDFKIESWKLKKLITQRRLFSEDQLTSFHDNLADLDRRAKNGKLIGDLGEELLILLLKL